MDPEAPDTPAGHGIPALAPVPPVALVLASITSVQIGAALAATLFDRAGPAGTSAVRLTIAALLLLALFRPWRRRHDRSALRVAALLGLVLGGMNLVFYAAVDRVPLGIVVTIEFLGPITVATIYSRRRADLVWVAMALAGVVLLAAPWRNGDALDGLGVLFAAIAAVLWGVYILLSERAGQRFSGGDGLAIAMVWGAALTLVPGVAQAGTALLDPVVLAAGLGVSLLSSVVPYTFEMEALRSMPKAVFGTLMSLEPGIAALAGLVILGQALDAREIVAIGLVVAASLGIMRRPGPVATPEATLDA